MTKCWTVLIAGSLATLLALFAPVPRARADIFQWEYINPGDPSQGKQQSTMLAPGGAGANVWPAAYLSGRDLTRAYLIGANLRDFWNFDYVGGTHFYTDLTGANLTQADLSNANLSGAVLTGADFTDAEVRGAKITSAEIGGGGGITLAQLYSTASYQAYDLSGMHLDGNDFAIGNFVGQNLTNARLFYANLTNANLSGANLTNAAVGSTLTDANLSQTNLTNATFGAGTLTGANLTGAEVRGASFYYSLLSVAQLYSTASYQALDLSGIVLHRMDLTGANLAGQNFTNASFWESTLTGANLSGADARGGSTFTTWDGVDTSNLIQSNGHIAGLELTASASLVVRDYDGRPASIPPTGPLVDPQPIVVEEHFIMDATGALRLVFDADPWNSTISFAPGINVALGGTLELTFAPGVDVATQSGRTIDLFDWTGMTPTGTFTISSPYTWDVSQLYTTGEVTLNAVSGLLPGDYSGNGVVDGADYTIWRDHLGQSFTLTNENLAAATPGIVDAEDYNFWISNFGQTLGSDSGATATATIPEPTTLLLMFAAVGWCVRPRRAS